MFSLATGIYQSYFAPPKLSILIIGTDGSGKTSLLERIKVTDISTSLQLDATAGAPSSLPASYKNGGAVAGLQSSSRVRVAGGAADDSGQTRRQQWGDEGGRPARLPPPLPPEQALRSTQWVEKAVEGGFSCLSEVDGGRGNGSPAGADPCFAKSVPPPPLVASGNSNASASTNASHASDSNPCKYASKKPPLPPRHDSIVKNAANSTPTTPVPEKPVKKTVKKTSFIELLRCPSPGRYSDAALDEEDEEEYHDNPSAKKDIPEPWSTEYLKDYYINYQRGQEFDLNQSRGGGSGNKMFPLDRIRPTLGQNLARLDLCGCKCSLFDLSGAEKMRPLWERYYRDADAVIYVVNAAESSSPDLLRSRIEYERMRQSEIIRRRAMSGLPILIFANQLDLAYEEYEASLERANKERNGRGISWNEDEEDSFVGGGQELATKEESISNRVVDFRDLAALFGFPQCMPTLAGSDLALPESNNAFLFGGSAKTGEGVRAAMEYLISHAKCYHLARQGQK